MKKSKLFVTKLHQLIHEAQINFVFLCDGKNAFGNVGQKGGSCFAIFSLCFGFCETLVHEHQNQ